MANETKEIASLELDGVAVEVVDVRGEEGMSRLFRYDVVAVADGRAPADVLGVAAQLVMSDGRGAQRVITGVCAEARTVFGVATQLAVTIRPAAYALSLGRDSRVFSGMSAVDIVRDVMARGGVAARFELAASYPVREYVAQYREDDLSFASRLLEEEGIYYAFDHEDGGAMVFGDDSSAAPELAGGARIAFSLDAGLLSPEELVHELGSASEVAPTKFTVGSFDPSRPAFPVGGGAGAGALEIYDAPGAGAVDPAVCAARAKVALEGARARGATVSGNATSVRVVPGRILEITGHPLARLDGRYLVTSIGVEVQQRRRAGGALDKGYACRFDAQREAAPFRPAPVTPPGRQAGLQTGVVVGPSGEEIHTNAAGHVRVQLHWDRLGGKDEAAGKWMRIAQRGTAASMLLPRVGWNVVTYNEEGASEAPSVLMRLHDAERPPVYPLPANKTRLVFRTRTSPDDGSVNEIHFEDKKGAEVMYFNAARDQNILVQNIKSDSVTRDATHVIGNDTTLTVHGPLTQQVLGNQTVTVGGNDSLKVANGRKIDVVMADATTVGGSRFVTTPMHNDHAESTRSLTVGAALLDICLGGIASDSLHVGSVLVGGAVLRVSAGGIADDAGKVGVQTVGGAKIEIAKKDRVFDNKNRFFETVGGAMLLSTEDEYVDGSEKKTTWSVGGLLTASAPEVALEATDRIELRCGASVITVTDGTVEIAATSFDLKDADQLIVVAQQVSHNP